MATRKSKTIPKSARVAKIPNTDFTGDIAWRCASKTWSNGERTEPDYAAAAQSRLTARPSETTVRSESRATHETIPQQVVVVLVRRQRPFVGCTVVRRHARHLFRHAVLADHLVMVDALLIERQRESAGNRRHERIVCLAFPVVGVMSSARTPRVSRASGTSTPRP